MSSCRRLFWRFELVGRDENEKLERDAAELDKRRWRNYEVKGDKQVYLKRISLKTKNKLLDDVDRTHEGKEEVNK